MTTTVLPELSRPPHTDDCAEELPSPERVIARLRSHARSLFWPSGFFISTAAATGFFFGSFDDEWMNLLVLCGGGAVTFFACLVPFFAWLGRRYTVTTRRIIVRHGLFVRVRQEFLHARGYEITVRQNWVQSIFRSGNVNISLGSGPSIVLRDVPRAALLHDALSDLVEARRVEPTVASGGQSWR